MEICHGDLKNSHNEIVYDEKHCPLCDALTTIKELQDEIDRLNSEE